MTPKRLRIYVAGPYTAPHQGGMEDNTNRAIDAGLLILKKGHIPFIPHLTHYVDRRARQLGKHITWEEYIAWDMEWLAVCDALLLLGNSKGADFEITESRNRGLRLFFSIDEIPAVSHPA